MIELPGRPIAQAWATDLLERDLGELPVEPDGTLRVTVPAWGLATVRVVLAPRGGEPRGAGLEGETRRQGDRVTG